METTGIEWTSYYNEYGKRIDGGTFNIRWGCQKVDSACLNCYAETWDKRVGGNNWRPGNRRVMSNKYWSNPLRWNKKAIEEGFKKIVFCSSMADVFEDSIIPELSQRFEQERQRLWRLIEQTDGLIWMLLTKRPENILRMIPAHWRKSPRDNVWFGATVQEQSAIQRAIDLCNVPATVRFLSCEPLIGEVDLSGVIDKLSMVITGGESTGGFRSRPMNPAWIESIDDLCSLKRVPHFFKQWGDFRPANGCEAIASMLKINAKFHKFEDGNCVFNTGDKHVNGALFKGTLIRNFPLSFNPRIVDSQSKSTLF